MIEVRHLTKKYGPNTAVDDISFTVEKGRIYGFLGPNGAGKSTTMNIICGCLAATDGEVIVDGHDIYEEGFMRYSGTDSPILSNNRKNSSKRSEFLRFYLYFCHVIQSFICFKKQH